MNQFSIVIVAMSLIIIAAVLFTDAKPESAPLNKPDTEEYFADEIDVKNSSISFTVKSAGGVRRYHYGGDCQNLSILVHDVPMIGPYHAGRSKYKIKITTDDLGAYFVTVWPINQDD